MADNFIEVKNFLTTEELKNIEQNVLALSEYFKPINEYNRLKEIDWPHQEPFVLGDALPYLQMHTPEEINWGTQELLKIKFSSLYTKIKDQLTELFPNVNEFKFSKRLPSPGFHIFHLPNKEVREFKWHNDTSILEWIHGIDIQDVWSIIIPITMPSYGIFLEYMEEDQEKIYNYTLGSMHLWPSTLRHRIGTIPVHNGDSRITLQGHFYIKDKTAVIYF